MLSNKKFKSVISDKDKILAADVYQKFKDAMLAKAPYTERWFTYLNAWDNSLYENSSVPSYKTNHVSNFIYSTIESMRPILFDQDPKFEAIPVSLEGIQYANDINTLLDWEWHRTNMTEICLANSVYTFSIGTSIIMLNYEFSDNKGSGTDGEVTPVKVSPFNLYPDPLATSVEDAEYIIYADYFHVNKLKQKFPQYSDVLQGGDVQYSELVNDRDKNSNIDNQVLVLEMWCRDYSSIEETDPSTGEKIKKKKYPNGRVITVAPEIGVVLSDKENPYHTGRFPFFIFKDIDVPFQFWGEGEVRWLIAPQKQANDLYNQIIDNAKNTANMQWIIDKNAGIPKGELTNRPGLIIRKNPGTEIRRDAPPSMPMYVQEMINTLKNDIEVVSGVHDVTRGETPSGIQSAAAIVALQEAAQTRIRLKVKLHEHTLGKLGTEWYERIKQYWKFDRNIPLKKAEQDNLPEMQLNGYEMIPNGILTGNEPSYDILNISPEKHLNQDYIVKVIGASVMSSSRASMFDQMIRLMQTPAEDGMPCVPREAVLDYLPDVNKRAIMQYFAKLKQEKMQMQQQEQMNNQSAEMLNQISQEVQNLSGIIGQLQNRANQEDEEKKRNELLNQGYEQGMNEASALQNQMDKSGALPPELLEEISVMDDESLGLLLEQHPEIVDML